MKRNRLIWFGLLVLSLVGISFRGGAIAYGFFYCMLLLPFMSLVYLLYVYVFFKVYQKNEGKNVTANQVVPFYFTLQNEGLFSLVSIKVNFYSSFSKICDIDYETEYELVSKGGVQLFTNLICKYRGEYDVGVKSVEIQDFLRMFRFTFKNKSPLRVNVQPQIVNIDSLKTIEEAFISERESQENPVEKDLLVRNYVPGDDTRLIQWKASAKRDELMVRKLIGEEKSGIGIIMSTQRSRENIKEYLPLENKMLECMLALALYYCGKNMGVSSYYENSNGLVVKSVDHMKHFESLYREVCSLQFEKEWEDAVLFENCKVHPAVLKNKILFLIVQEFTGKTQEFVDFCKRSNVFVVVYYIVSEEEKQLEVVDSKHFVFRKIGQEDRLEEVV